MIGRVLGYMLPAVMLCYIYTTPLNAQVSDDEEVEQVEKKAEKKKKKKKLSWKKKLKAADYSVQIANYYVAAKYYQEVLEERPDMVDVQFKLAETAYEIRHFILAEEMYKKVMDAAGDEYPKSYFMYPLMLKMNGKYEEAIKEFKNFPKKARAFKDSQEATDYKKQARNEIEGCEYAMEAMAKPDPVSIFHLGNNVNKPNTEFSPYPYKDQLIYSSVKADSFVTLTSKTQSQSSLAELGYLAKIYTAEKINDSTFTSGEPFPAPINNDIDHNGSGTFSTDGQRFYFTRSVKDESSNNLKFVIYTTEKDVDGIWKEPVAVGGIDDSRFSNKHPVSVNTTYRRKKLEVLYFASNREGGEGGWDIWFATRPTGAEFDEPFDAPENCGRRINTPGNEISPFFDLKTSTFYFSSSGQVGMGGYDIFYTHGQLKRWDRTENMGYPINSSVDDMFFAVNEETTGGYLVSNRDGAISFKHPHCCDDIFGFKWVNIINLAVTGLVKERGDSTDITLDTAKVALYVSNVDPELLINENGKNKTSSIQVVEHDDVLIGTFDIHSDPLDEEANKMYFFKLNKNQTYKVVGSKEGYIADFKFVSTMDVTESDTFRADLFLRPKAKSFVLHNILYDFDAATLRPESKLTIDTLAELLLAEENSRLIVEISSHTDSKGDDAYNENLSQRRAQSVVDYLISSGVEKQRLVAKGYGESKPIAPNENPDGSDNPDGRQQNRRTEFKVLGELEEILYDTEK